jgi:HK97 family phage major capsid protein
LLDVAYALAAPYRANARWVMNSATARILAKYKDQQNQYLWQPSVINGQPDRFLGYPVTIAEAMPDVGANTFPIAFGDFSRGYLIVDKVGSRLVRDPYSKPGFIRLYAYRRTHGATADSNAIKLLKIAST